MSTKQPVNIQIQADEETKAGTYANLAMISHSAEEFVCDFIFVHPPYGKLRSRIIMSAGHAKRFLRALQENVARYESQHGTIPDTGNPPPGILPS